MTKQTVLGSDTLPAGTVKINANFTELYDTKADTTAAAADATAKANSARASAIQRANHTGTQTASTIGDFNTAVQSLIDASSGGGSSPSLRQLVSFNAALPLDGYKYFAQVNVSGALTFTAGSGAVADGSVIARFRANGTNAPAFTGFSEVVGSSGYDNRSGVINSLIAWFDGVDYLLSWSQRIGDTGMDPGDTTAPTLSSAAVTNGTPSVVNLLFNEALDTTVTLLASAFTISGHTVSAVAFGTSTRVDVTVSAPFVNGEAARTVAYTQPGATGNRIRDIAGNSAVSFSGVAISNGVSGSDVTAPTLSSAAVANSTPTVVNLVFNEPLDMTATLLTSAFTVSGHTITGAAFGSSTRVDLTVSAAFVNGETARTVSYTQPGSSANRIKDTAGNSAATFSGSAITNNVSAGGGGTDPQIVRFGNVSGGTESGDGTAGYLYSFNTSGGYGNQASLALPNGTDGYFISRIPTADGCLPVFSVATDREPTAFDAPSIIMGYYVLTDSTYKAVHAGSGGQTPNVNSTITWLPTDRQRIMRVGSVWTLAISKDAGATFTLIHNFPGTQTVKVWPTLTQFADGSCSLGPILASPSAAP